MSLDRAREYFRRWNVADRMMEFQTSSATVELAAIAVGCEPARIAKTLSFRVEGRCILVVTAGDARIDNKKFKSRFNVKARMLAPEETEPLIGHEIGGVCPFGVNPGVETYLDQSLRRFTSVFPACGSANSAIELTPAELELFSAAVEWVDICKDWQQPEAAATA